MSGEDAFALSFSQNAYSLVDRVKMPGTSWNLYSLTEELKCIALKVPVDGHVTEMQFVFRTPKSERFTLPLSEEKALQELLSFEHLSAVEFENKIHKPLSLEKPAFTLNGEKIVFCPYAFGISESFTLPVTISEGERRFSAFLHKEAKVLQLFLGRRLFEWDWKEAHQRDDVLYTWETAKIKDFARPKDDLTLVFKTSLMENLPPEFAPALQKTFEEYGAHPAVLVLMLGITFNFTKMCLTTLGRFPSKKAMSDWFFHEVGLYAKFCGVESIPERQPNEAGEDLLVSPAPGLRQQGAGQARESLPNMIRDVLHSMGRFIQRRLDDDDPSYKECAEQFRLLLSLYDVIQKE